MWCCNLFLSSFRASNNAMKAEARAPTSSLDLSQSSSDSAYCSHRPMIFIDPVNQEVFGTALHDAVHNFGQADKETCEIIAITREEIHELKNRQTLAENVLKNLLCGCHGKPVVTYLGMQAP